MYVCIVAYISNIYVFEQEELRSKSTVSKNIEIISATILESLYFLKTYTKFLDL